VRDFSRRSGGIDIDFALCGPGHPAYDLARFGMAVLLTHFRMGDDEKPIAELAKSVFAGATYEELRADIAPGSSRCAVRALCASRDSAYRSIERYGGSRGEFDALALIMAIQSLAIQIFKRASRGQSFAR
jgi:hypothetical protein